MEDGFSLRTMDNGPLRVLLSVISDTASAFRGASSRSGASRLARLNSRISMLPPKSSIKHRHGRQGAGG